MSLRSVAARASADSRHGRLRARTDEAHLLDRGIARDDSFGQVGFGRGRSAKARRLARGPLDGLDHGRKGVAQDHRSPGAEVVDVAIAVRIGQVRALRAVDKRRSPTHRAKRPNRRVDAAGEKALGALLQGLGTGVCGGGRLGTHGVQYRRKPGKSRPPVCAVPGRRVPHPCDPPQLGFFVARVG